jgi:flagellar hook-associated protein 2
MAGISFGGLATGLPTDDIVSSLMAVERRPLDRLEADKTYETERLKAYGQFNDKLDALRTAVGSLNITSEVRTTSVRLNSEEFITAASTSASTGSYDIGVKQLAQVQKDVTAGYSSSTEAILGTGSLTINSQVIAVDSSNNSLEGLMEAINAVSEDTGVSASLINDGNNTINYHLIFTGKDAATTFSITPALQNGSVEFTTSSARDAQQAIAYVDGIEVVGNSNTLSGVIAGVTINLNNENTMISDGVYETSTLNVEADTERLKEKLSTFISSYNGIMEWIHSGYDEITATTEEVTTEGETSEEESLSNFLRGDATINGIKRNLQSILSDSVGTSGTIQILSEIGISTQVDGTLLLNDSKLDSALESKFEDVVKLLVGENSADGAMKKFNTYLLDATSASGGMYAEKRDRYESSVRRLDDQIIQKEAMMDKIEFRIRSQFDAMELLISNLNATSDYLTQQMDMLANLSSGNN